MKEDELEALPSLKTIDVDTGELRVSSGPVILQSIALGSCIALAVYEPDRKIGGLAHIMLPGMTQSSRHPTKYAINAIDALIDSVEKLGAKTENLEISIVGGANILREGDIPEEVTKSVVYYLKKLQLGLNRMRVGGFERRSVFLDTTSGRVFFSEGNDPTRRLLKEIKKV